MLITIKPKKISLYLANCKYSASQVQALTGADIVLNGTLYTFATMRPCLDFKADRVVYSDETPLYEGYGWNNNATIMTRTTNMASYDNFISSCNIIKQGKACSVDGIAWVAGARQRTAIGWTKEGRMVIYVTPYNQTIATITQEMLKAGCVDAINLDGGASTQIATKKYGNVLSSTGRKVQNYICIWEDSIKPTIPKTNTSYWAQTPTAVTKFPLTIRGTVNLNVRQLPTSFSKLVRSIPKGTEFPTDGYAYSWNKAWMKISDGYVYRIYTECNQPYQEPTGDIRKGDSGEGVRWVQWWLGQRGYRGLDGKVLGCDGQFGPNTDYALRVFQREYNLTMDGICGEKTRLALKS